MLASAASNGTITASVVGLECGGGVQVGQQPRLHARHFPRKIDAERWLSTVQADTLRGTYGSRGGSLGGVEPISTEAVVGQEVCDGRVGLYAGFCGRGALRHCPGRRPSI